MKQITFSVRPLAVAVILLAMMSVGFFSGCDELLPVGRGVPNSLPPAAGGDTVTIGSFNIQVFGDSKMKKSDVMKLLAKTIRQFDVVAIQEIRTKTPHFLDKFLEKVNSDGGHYRFIIGPREGRTVSKEQYAYIYNAATIELIEGSAHSIPDPSDRLHRPPFVASFRVRGPPVEKAFRFTLVNIHTDPDEVKTELVALRNVYRAVRRNDPAEDDVILLGDLNANVKKLRKYGWPDQVHCAIQNVKTNTAQTKLYDNLLFDRQATAEYTGQFGVFNFMTEYNLTQTKAKRVSDHMPVWGVFSSREK